MNNWYSLGLSPINKLIEDHRQLDLEALLIAICNGREKLYRLVPSECSVDITPNRADLIDVTGLFAELLPSDKPAKDSKLWSSSPALKSGPLAVQVCPQAATELARTALFELITNNKDAALQVDGFGMYDGLVDEDGTKLTLARIRLDIYERIAALKEAGIDWKKFSPISGEDTYLDYDYSTVAVGELAITRDCLRRNLGELDQIDCQHDSVTEMSVQLPTHPHPVKDPDHPFYAPELHVALEVWEALYLRGEKPEHIGHAQAAWHYVRKHFLDMNIDENLVKNRIGPVSNTAMNKNPSKRGSTKS